MLNDQSVADYIIVDFAVTDGKDTSNIITKTISVDYATEIEKRKTFAKDGYSLKVAPTPTKDSGKVLVVSEESGEATFTIFTRTERKLAKISKEIEANDKLEFTWDVISKLQPDVYFIEMKVNGEVKAISTLVKIE